VEGVINQHMTIAQSCLSRDNYIFALTVKAIDVFIQRNIPRSNKYQCGEVCM